MWQLPKNKPSHQHRIIYKNTQKCVQHSRSIKNSRNSAIHWFLCNCGIIRTLYGLCQTCKYKTWNAGLLDRREEILKAKKFDGIIREAILLQRATLLERIRYLLIIKVKNDCFYINEENVWGWNFYYKLVCMLLLEWS